MSVRFLIARLGAGVGEVAGWPGQECGVANVAAPLMLVGCFPPCRVPPRNLQQGALRGEGGESMGARLSAREGSLRGMDRRTPRVHRAKG